MRRNFRYLFLLVLSLLFWFFVSAQTHQGKVELNIQQGSSCCTYGKTINFGIKAISFSGYSFTGNFLSNMDTTMWNCIDMYGVETGWTMVVQMQGPMTSEAGNTIVESNVQISYGDTELIGGNCVPRVHSGVDVPLSSPVILLEKDGLNPANYGSVCAMQTNNVKMKVVVDPAQAPGNYTGTIVIDIPGFMSTCTGGMLVQGAVYDSEIEGLSYVGNFGSSGVTLSGGKFTYMIGETVSFSLGGMEIGSLVPATDRKVFLPEILGKSRTDLTDQKVVEVARLLQGLDQDNNVNNGITITSSDANAITGTLSGSAVNQKLISLGKPVKTAEAVVNHLEQTLVNSFTETGNVEYPWAVKRGGSSADGIYNSYTDVSGNTYLAGYVYGNGSVGSVSGAISLVSSGSYDAVLAKYDSGGNLKRIVKGGGAGSDWFQGISADVSGNVYVAGKQGTTVSNRGPYSTSNSNGVFIGKISANGSWLGFKALTGFINQVSLSTDKLGYLYLESLFAGTVTIAGTTLISSGGNDVALVKLDSGFNILWAKKVGGTLTDYIWANPVVDSQQNVYFGVEVTGTIVVGTSNPLVVSGMYDGLLVKYSSAGDLLWHKYITGSAKEWISALAVDGYDNPYVFVSYDSPSCYIDDKKFSTKGGGDLSLVKMNSAGSISWIATGGSSYGEYSSLGTILFDKNQNLFVAYEQQGTGVFGNYQNPAFGIYDMGLLRVSSTGQWLGAWHWGSSLADLSPRTFSMDSDNNIYMAGIYYSGPLVLGKYSLGHSGSTDVFLKKIPYRELY